MKLNMISAKEKKKRADDPRFFLSFQNFLCLCLKRSRFILFACFNVVVPLNTIFPMALRCALRVFSTYSDVLSSVFFIIAECNRRVS